MISVKLVKFYYLRSRKKNSYIWEKKVYKVIDLHWMWENYIEYE